MVRRLETVSLALFDGRLTDYESLPYLVLAMALAALTAAADPLPSSEIERPAALLMVADRRLVVVPAWRTEA